MIPRRRFFAYFTPLFPEEPDQQVKVIVQKHIGVHGERMMFFCAAHSDAE